MGHSLGVAMQGGNPVEGRKAHDFYATPDDVTLALLAKVRHRLRGPVAEPACGDGAICRVLEAQGLSTIPTDLHDRGYGGHGGGHDILAIDRLVADEYITNPPFEIAPKIIARIMELRPRFFALLLKGTFWHAKTRIALWDRFPPAAVYPLTWRPDFENRGRPTLEMCWTVWDAGHVGDTVYAMLPRPPGYGPVPRIRAEGTPKRVRKSRAAPRVLPLVLPEAVLSEVVLPPAAILQIPVQAVPEALVA